MFTKIEKLNEGLWKNETLWKCSLNKTEKFGVCDYKDNIILPFIFDEIEINGDKKVIGKMNDKLYYFECNFKNDETKLEQIIKDDEIFFKNSISKFSSNLWKFYSKEKKKCGVTDSYGNIVIPFEYDILANNVTVGQYEFLFAINDNKFGFLDKTGKVVIPLTYEHIEIFNEDLVAAKLNGKYGFIDIHNEVKIPFIYDEVIGMPACFNNGKAFVELNGEKVWIDKTGEIIVK